jgi:hypothetical protein
MFDLGGLDLRGVSNLNGVSGIVDWTSGQSNWSWGGSWANGQVGGSDAESVDGVRNVLDLLDDSVGINVRVSSAGDAIGGSHFGLGRWTTGVAVRVLSELILGMVLGGDWSRCNNWGSISQSGVPQGRVGQWGVTGGGNGQNSGENNERLHDGFWVLRISPNKTKCS